VAEGVEDGPVREIEDKPVEGTEVELRYCVDYVRYQDRRGWHQR